MAESQASAQKKRGGLFSASGIFAPYQPIDPQDRHIYRALEENKREGLLLAVRARWVALSATAVLMLFVNPNFDSLYHYVLLALMALNGFFQLRIGQVGRSYAEVLLLLFDVLLMTAALALPNPLVDGIWPAGLSYKFGTFYYFFVLLTAVALGYSWRTVFTFGIWCGIIWMLTALGMYFFGERDPAITQILVDGLGDNNRFIEAFDPNEVRLVDRFAEAVIIIIVAGILALNGFRMNRLLLSQAETARQRGNLSRYFAPSMVDALAGRDQPFGEVRSQSVALLFADIVGFTAMAEKSEPKAVIETLREFHRRCETAVFDHGGTLDKYLGDGLMVSFGTPDAGPDDATRALRCALAMEKSMIEWNAVREQSGKLPIRLSIGIHYGPVIMGEIGSERRMELATLGDSVNVAARLEAATRQLDTNQIISESLVARLVEEMPDNEKLLANFKRADEPLALRGRNQKITVWRREAQPSG